ncbi:MAG: hypothetical protein WKF87_13500 [Chryseolinea sp.]
MEKALFIDVLKHFSKSSENEALNVIALKQAFPYSQVLHALAARLTKDHGLNGIDHALQTAAIYASDRAVLKNVMTLEELPGVSIVTNIPKGVVVQPPVVMSGDHHIALVNTTIAASEAPVVTVRRTVEEIITEPAVDGMAKVDIIEAVNVKELRPLKGQSVADQVMDDLETLHRLKHDFEVSFEANQVHRAKAALREAEAEVIVQDESGSQKSRRSRIIEAAKSLLRKDAKDEHRVEDVPKPAVSRKRHSEAMIDEIVNGKQQIEPESPRQMEQIQMIDKFIRTQPTISNKDKFIQAPEGDLATIKTGEFTDNIVSETLVEILLKQGKRDKAIEVLKKLIWKFPQKKAYFAAQIEDLKQ